MLIYIVDDEENIRKTLKFALLAEQYQVKTFMNGIEAEMAVKNETPDLIILDWFMPVQDGITFLENIRSQGIMIPVIFISWYDEEEKRIDALEKGADDYIGKPYSIKELLTRIKVVLRRYQSFSLQPSAEEILTFGNLELNLSSYTGKINNSPVDFTVTEFRILEAFVKNPEIVFTREKLLEIAFPEDKYSFDRAIDSHIKRLRKKIGSSRIETVYGAGYKLV